MGAGQLRILGRAAAVVAVGLGCGRVLATVNDSSWVGGTGTWTDASKWIPATVPDNGTPMVTDAYNTFINVPGVYTVTFNAPATVNSLTLNNPSAVFMQQSTLTLATGGAVSILQGTYNSVNARIVGAQVNVAPAAGFHILGTTTLIDSNLSGDVTVEDGRTLGMQGSSTFQGSQVRLASTGGGSRLQISGGQIAGMAEIIVDANSDVRTSSSMDIGAGIVIRSGTGTAAVNASGSSTTVTNFGIISAQTPGHTLSVLNSSSTATVHNNGTFMASNGGMLSVSKLNGDAGFLSIAGTSSIRLTSRDSFTLNQPMGLTGGNSLLLGGSFTVNQPLTVGAGATLQVSGSWINNAPVSVNGGTLIMTASSSDTYTHTANASFTVSNSNVVFGSSHTPTFVESFFGDGNMIYLRDSYTDNTGHTLAVSSASGSIRMMDGAQIYGGNVITDSSTSFIVSDGTDAPGNGARFYNVNFNGTVQGQPGSYFGFGDTSFSSGMSINHGTIGTNAGSIFLTGQWSNQGTIIANGGWLEFDGPAVSMGAIVVSNTQVNLRDQINASQLNSISGTINQVLFDGGVLDLEGGSYTPPANVGAMFLNGGKVQNGTLADGGTGKVLLHSGLPRSSTMENVTLAMNLTFPDLYDSKRPANPIFNLSGGVTKMPA